ncbi:RagB/SusD family nutrient uptake outer membrane protein [Algoriphagus sp. NG3]|uniref:RagB/SusD family nutrient uptake outer membrane protein n=1 Tax=Algoriphagus sp. NG3 TaxID=3097546 RepID=UPI002A7F9C74|nr:RagB/SusD family nutrient uptake outer membrane protein [Algoriphagus sp. NG3]WPR76031.1 RagB/SusD family nutrient uptake outer membrane protein [Algoriphagus sp. NG3]
MKNKTNTLILILSFCGIFSCNGFLDEKPDKSILVPQTASEFEALIDNFDRINSTPVLPFIYADDYWTTPSNWNNFAPWVQNAYKWSNDPYLPNESTLDFSILYRKIFTCNVVLDKVYENPPWKQEEIDRMKAKALFWKAHGYYELAVLFLPIPDKRGDSEEFKIPFRNTGTFGPLTEWRSASELFPVILADLEEALKFLPGQTQYPTQPSRFAAHALLARINL